MILLNKNPVADLGNLNDIELVFKNGKPVSPDTLLNETPGMLVQRLWNSYNAKNMKAFLACFHPDVRVYNSSATVLYKGIKQVENNYASQLQISSEAHCEIKSRIVSGNTVVDKVVLKEPGKNEERIIVFKINNHKINNVNFY
jgi:hypothetical protein